MANENKIVKFWRGTRSSYNALGTNKKLDYMTRYTVIESDGRRTEYFGNKPITVTTGELYPVIDVVETLPDNLSVGDRYLVGHDKTDSSDAEYYLVEIAADITNSTIDPIGDLSVRIISKGLKSYHLVDGILTTYDGNIDCGTF